MKPVLNVLLTLTMVAATVALAGQQTMPPSFSEQSEPETVLRAYPLGITTKQAAFSHHGKVLSTLVLPNAKEGWVYEVGVSKPKPTSIPQGKSIPFTKPGRVTMCAPILWCSTTRVWSST